MAIGNYAELQAAIIDWADRPGDTTFSDRVPDFIRMFELGFSRQHQVGQMERTSILTTAGDGYTLPSDLSAIRDVWTSAGGRNYPLQAVSGSYMDVTTGVPRYYYVQGNKLYISPESPATVTVRYYAQVPALSTGSPTNWLLTQHPDAYLYGALIESLIYTRDEERAALWKGKLDDIITQILKNDASQRWNGVSPANYQGYP